MTKLKKPLETTRRTFVAGSAAAVSTFFIGRPKALAGDAEITLKLATVAPKGTPWERLLKRVRKRVQEGTGGRVRVKPYWGGAAGDEISTISRTRKGGLQMWGGSAGAAASLIPELAALELPYLFPNLSTADDILDNKVGSDIDAMLKKANLKLICFSENGHRSIGTNFGFVKSTSDLKGKKMRSQQSDVHLNMWRSMGATPEPIPITETLTALQTGVVDGFDNTPLFTFAASLYRSASHFTLTEHIYQPAVVVVNLDTWNSLPQDVKELLGGDMKGDSQYGRKKVRALNPALIDNFKAANIAVHKSTSSERTAFKKATAPTHKKFTSKYGSTLYKKITKYT